MAGSRSLVSIKADSVSNMEIIHFNCELQESIINIKLVNFCDYNEVPFYCWGMYSNIVVNILDLFYINRYYNLKQYFIFKISTKAFSWFFNLILFKKYVNTVKTFKISCNQSFFERNFDF